MGASASRDEDHCPSVARVHQISSITVPSARATDDEFVNISGIFDGEDARFSRCTTPGQGLGPGENSVAATPEGLDLTSDSYDPETRRHVLTVPQHTERVVRRALENLDQEDPSSDDSSGAEYAAVPGQRFSRSNSMPSAYHALAHAEREENMVVRQFSSPTCHVAPHVIPPLPTGDIRSSRARAKPPEGTPRANSLRRSLYQRPSGKGRGKGKGAPPPPPPKAGGPRKPSAPAAQPISPPNLPIGRRLAMRSCQAQAPVFRECASLIDSACSTPGVTPTGTPRSGTPRKVDPTAVDLSALRDAFAPQKSSKPVTKRAPQRTELLPRSAAQNVAIVLTRFRVDTQQLADAVTRLDAKACKLNSDNLSRLIEAWPQEQALKPVIAYLQQGADVSQLRDVEKQLVPLVRIPRLAERLRLVSLMTSVEDRTTEALADLARLRQACRELQTSAILGDLLTIVVVLFNYVNFGHDSQASKSLAPLRGVDVQSLLRLTETKAYKGDFPNFNMLHFVIKQLLQQRPDLEPGQLEGELSTVGSAARVSLESMQQALKQLQVDRDFVQAELKDHRGTYEEEASCSEDDDNEPVPQAVGRTLIEAMLGKGMDLASFADSWIRGNEVVGAPYHPYLNPSGFQPVFGPDAKPPPPGWLWLYNLSGNWQKCWCEVRASVLVIYKVDGKRCRGAVYIALPSATVTMLDSIDASEVAQRLKEDAPFGFEVCNKSSGQVVRLCAKSEREALRWQEILVQQAAVPGCGFVMVHHGGWPILGAGSRRYFCMVQDGLLHGYARPRDGIEGAPAERTWRLDGATVRSLADQDASAAAVRLAQSSTPFGFELEAIDECNGETSRTRQMCWQFVCDTPVEEGAWLRELLHQIPSTGQLKTPHEVGSPGTSDHVAVLPPAKLVCSREEFMDAFAPDAGDGIQGGGARLREQLALSVQDTEATATESLNSATAPPAASSPPVPHSKGSVSLLNTMQLQGINEADQEDDYDSSDGEAIDHAPKRRTLVWRLEVLDSQLAKKIDHLEREINSSSADGRALLLFFGLEVPAAPRLGEPLMRLMSTIIEFLRQFRVAFDELGKRPRHGNGQPRRSSNSAVQDGDSRRSSQQENALQAGFTGVQQQDSPSESTSGNGCNSPIPDGCEFQSLLKCGHLKRNSVTSTTDGEPKSPVAQDRPVHQSINDAQSTAPSDSSLKSSTGERCIDRQQTAEFGFEDEEQRGRFDFKSLKSGQHKRNSDTSAKHGDPKRPAVQDRPTYQPVKGDQPCTASGEGNVNRSTVEQYDRKQTADFGFEDGEQSGRLNMKSSKPGHHKRHVATCAKHSEPKSPAAHDDPAQQPIKDAQQSVAPSDGSHNSSTAERGADRKQTADFGLDDEEQRGRLDFRSLKSGHYRRNSGKWARCGASRSPVTLERHLQGTTDDAHQKSSPSFGKDDAQDQEARTWQCVNPNPALQQQQQLLQCQLQCQRQQQRQEQQEQEQPQAPLSSPRPPPPPGTPPLSPLPPPPPQQQRAREHMRSSPDRPVGAHAFQLSVPSFDRESQFEWQMQATAEMQAARRDCPGKSILQPLEELPVAPGTVKQDSGELRGLDSEAFVVVPSPDVGHREVQLRQQGDPQTFVERSCVVAPCATPKPAHREKQRSQHDRLHDNIGSPDGGVAESTNGAEQHAERPGQQAERQLSDKTSSILAEQMKPQVVAPWLHIQTQPQASQHHSKDHGTKETPRFRKQPKERIVTDPLPLAAKDAPRSRPPSPHMSSGLLPPPQPKVQRLAQKPGVQTCGEFAQRQQPEQSRSLNPPGFRQQPATSPLKVPANHTPLSPLSPSQEDLQVPNYPWRPVTPSGGEEQTNEVPIPRQLPQAKLSLHPHCDLGKDGHAIARWSAGSDPSVSFGGSVNSCAAFSENSFGIQSGRQRCPSSTCGSVNSEVAFSATVPEHFEQGLVRHGPLHTYSQRPPHPVRPSQPSAPSPAGSGFPSPASSPPSTFKDMSDRDVDRLVAELRTRKTVACERNVHFQAIGDELRTRLHSQSEAFVSGGPGNMPSASDPAALSPMVFAQLDARLPSQQPDWPAALAKLPGPAPPMQPTGHSSCPPSPTPVSPLPQAQGDAGTVVVPPAKKGPGHSLLAAMQSTIDETSKTPLFAPPAPRAPKDSAKELSVPPFVSRWPTKRPAELPYKTPRWGSDEAGPPPKAFQDLQRVNLGACFPVEEYALSLPLSTHQPEDDSASTVYTDDGTGGGSFAAPSSCSSLATSATCANPGAARIVEEAIRQNAATEQSNCQIQLSEASRNTRTLSTRPTSGGTPLPGDGAVLVVDLASGDIPEDVARPQFFSLDSPRNSDDGTGSLLCGMAKNGGSMDTAWPPSLKGSLGELPPGGSIASMPPGGSRSAVDGGGQVPVLRDVYSSSKGTPQMVQSTFGATSSPAKQSSLTPSDVRVSVGASGVSPFDLDCDAPEFASPGDADRDGMGGGRSAAELRRRRADSTGATFGSRGDHDQIAEAGTGSAETDSVTDDGSLSLRRGSNSSISSVCDDRVVPQSSACIE